MLCFHCRFLVEIQHKVVLVLQKNERSAVSSVTWTQPKLLTPTDRPTLSPRRRAQLHRLMRWCYAVCTGAGGCNENNGGCVGLCVTSETGATSSHQCLCDGRTTQHFDADTCTRQQRGITAVWTWINNVYLLTFNANIYWTFSSRLRLDEIETLDNGTHWIFFTFFDVRQFAKSPWAVVTIVKAWLWTYLTQGHHRAVWRQLVWRHSWLTSSVTLIVTS